MGKWRSARPPKKTVNYAQELKAKKIYITTTIKAKFSMQKNMKQPWMTVC